MEEKLTSLDEIFKAISVIRGSEISRVEETALCADDIFPVSANIKRELESKIKSGDKMPDGSIYLGYKQGQDWYVTAEDARGTDGKRLRFRFSEASAYAKRLNAHSHTDWKVPPNDRVNGEDGILSMMYHYSNEGAFQGTYSPTDSLSSFYWSSSALADGKVVELVHFRWGDRTYTKTTEYGSLRCVRSVPRAPQ